MRLIDADTLIEKYGDWYTEEGTEEGFKGALKWLIDKQPTVQPEPCEDAVSREAAVNAIKKEIEMNNEVLRSSTITYATRECISQRNGQAREDIAAIEVLPSVTPICLEG